MGIWVNGEKFEGVYNEDSVVGSLVCRDWRIGAMSRLFFFFTKSGLYRANWLGVQALNY